MKAIIKIAMDNDAFANNPSYELARMLRDLADLCELGMVQSPCEKKLYDINGNLCGTCVVKGK